MFEFIVNTIAVILGIVIGFLGSAVILIIRALPLIIAGVALYFIFA